jgi:hypothetical protein
MAESELSGFSRRVWPFVVGMLCVGAFLPLLRPESPCTHDGSAHHFRVVALQQALRQGILFSRYLPDLAFGYGYPFFNYRAPLPYYLILVLRLSGIGLPLAQNVAYALCILGSAFAVYLLARDLFGPRAAVVAAVAYAYAPYQFLDALLRGNIPESVALCLMPLILWAFRRLALQGRRRWFLVSVGSLTCLFLSHNISSLLFTPFLLAFLLVLWSVYRGAGHWWAVGGAIVLALGLTAFFWAPALLERGYVQLHMSYSTRNNDFHHNFTRLGEVMGPPMSVDTSLMNPAIRVHLGLPQALLAAVGVVVGLIRWDDQERRAQLLLFTLVAVLTIWMSTGSSLVVWEGIPLLRFVQFPWRLIGRAVLPVALLAGASASAIIGPGFRSLVNHRGRPQGPGYASIGLMVVLVAVLILAALPDTYPPLGYCPRAPHPTITNLLDYELRNRRAGLAASGSFFPVWVRERPDGSPLLDQYAAGDSIARFDETALPKGGQIVESDYGPNRARLVVDSPDPFRARYLSFYFPGWCVWVDGERVKVTPSDPEGLITFEVPGGIRTVRIRFGETPLRRVADVVSGLSLFALTVLVSLGWSSGGPGRSLILHPHTSISLLVTGALLLVLKLGVVDRMETPLRRAELRADGTLRDVEQALGQHYSDGLVLIGYDQSAGQMPADGALGVDLYWTARRLPSRRYQSVVHLEGKARLRWSPKDSLRPTDYQGAPPTTAWRPGRYALDSHEVQPLPATPPGTYDIVLTVFDRDTLAPLSVLNEQGQPVAPEFVLGQVTLTAPRRPFDVEQLNTRSELHVSLGPLDLVGAVFDNEEAAPGDPLFVTTFWRIEEELVEDLVFHLSLLAPDGSTVTTYDLPPTADWHPTSIWEPGRIWRGQHLLHLPAELNSGDYSWCFSISDSASRFEHPSVIRVVAPNRTFAAPAVDLEIDTRLDNVATLVGAIRNWVSSPLSPGTSLTVTLVWRSEVETKVSYRAFVHLIGPDGELAAQSDGVPAGWTRPTTGWLPGEYVEDMHGLTVPRDAPTGDYDLIAGLYAPGSGPGAGGERLTTPAGSDAVSLGTVAAKRED